MYSRRFGNERIVVGDFVQGQADGGKDNCRKMAVCSCCKDVILDLIHCTNCQRSVHNGCGVKGSLCKAKSKINIICSVYLCQSDSAVKSSVDVGDGSSVEIVDEFCNLGRHVVCEWRGYPKLWNTLPDDITSALSLLVFRRKLKTYLFRQSYLDIIL